MNRQLKAYIEAEIRDYHQTKKELEELKEDLINSSPLPPDGMPKARRPSDPTFKCVSSLLLDRRIRRLETIIRGIESVLDGLDEDKLKMVQLKYWDRRNLYNSDIADMIHVDKRTIERWDRAVCYAVALELGEISCRNNVAFEG